MKKLLLFFLILFSINAQTTMNAGDIAFIGHYADGTDGAGGDGFTFILLKDLAENTIIYFTDEGWNGSDGSWFGGTSESHFSWTVPSGGLTIGTIVYIVETTTTDVLSASTGTLSSFLAGSGWTLPSSGDQILAYQSSTGVRPTSPTFIAAADADYYTSYDGSNGWTNTTLGINTSNACYLPSGLSNATDCVALANSSQTHEYDNYKYNGTLTGTAAVVRTAINNYANWTGNDDGSIDISVSGYSTPNILPVELTDFTASLINNSIQLSWETATEVNNYGFNVELRIENGEWETKGFVQGNGTTNSPKSYSFTDTELPNVESVDYRLKQIDNDGTFAYSKTITVDLTTITSVNGEEIPTVFSLSQNYPNPFNPTTTIRFGLPESGLVQLTVYNILGEEVAQLVNKEMTVGDHQINFDASSLSSGMYIYRINVGDKFTSIRKMMLLK